MVEDGASRINVWHLSPGSNRPVSDAQGQPRRISRAHLAHCFTASHPPRCWGGWTKGMDCLSILFIFMLPQVTLENSLILPFTCLPEPLFLPSPSHHYSLFFGSFFSKALVPLFAAIVLVLALTLLFIICAADTLVACVLHVSFFVTIRLHSTVGVIMNT